MRQLDKTLKEIIEESGLTLNQISQASGISNPYLAKLVKIGINRPGKDKIASVMLALNYTISEIDQVLATYDYQPLRVDDIGGILANNRARKIVGGNLPQYDHIYFDLLLIVLERIGGKKILVKNRPSAVFMPHDLYLAKEFPYESTDAAADFRISLTRAILEERTASFLENCRAGYQTETFICKNCLAEYLERHLSAAARVAFPGRSVLISRYFANALSLSLKEPIQHRIMVMERCPYFHFLMQDADGETPKVSYPGRKLHSFNNEHDKRMLEGFTTDLPQIVSHFRHEIEMCRGAVLPEMENNFPSSLQDMFFSLFDRHGLADQLETALAERMKDPEISLY